MYSINKWKCDTFPETRLLLAGAACPVFTLICLIFSPGAFANDDLDELDSPHNTEFELTLSFESLIDTDDEAERNKRRNSLISSDLEANYLQRLTDRTTAYISVTGSIEQEKPDTGNTINREFFEIDELWIAWSHKKSLITAGRFNIDDGTGWWWNDELVGFGVHYQGDHATSQLNLTTSSESLSTLNEPTDPENDSIMRVLGNIFVPLSDAASLTTYLLHQSDQSPDYQLDEPVNSALFDESDSDVTWLGLRYQHNWASRNSGDVSLSFDAAYMTGKTKQYEIEDIDTTDNDQAGSSVTELEKLSISAWAVNAWGSWTPFSSKGTKISLGYAYGSGTKSDRSNDVQTFQQSGLHDNELTSAYYGEITAPSLSNLQITSFFVLHPLSANSDIFAQFNHYRRVSVFDETLDWDLDLEFDNRSNDVGLENAIGFQYEFNNGITTQFLYSQFQPGKAFRLDQQETIEYFELTLGYEF